MFKSKLIIFVVFSAFFVVEVYSVADPKFVAHLIYQKVTSKMHVNDANRQWSYLYLHRKIDDIFYCTNPEVNAILNEKGNIKMIPILTDGPIWPTTTMSNMRVAGLDQGSKSHTSNTGHSEKRLLQDFKEMMQSVFPNNDCPEFIILSTKLFLCSYSADIGCGIDFLKATQPVYEECATNYRENFRYIYIFQNADNDWNIQKKQFKYNKIPILFGLA